MARTNATGADLKNFFADESVWNHNGEKDAYYIDEDLITINGKEYDSDASYEEFGDSLRNLPDDALVTKVEGYFVWQGRGACPSERGDMGRFFNKWVKQQQTRTLVASFEIDIRTTPVEKLEQLMATLKELGAKVSGVTVEDLAPAVAAATPTEPEATQKPRAPGPR